MEQKSKITVLKDMRQYVFIHISGQAELKIEFEHADNKNDIDRAEKELLFIVKNKNDWQLNYWYEYDQNEYTGEVTNSNKYWID